MEGRVRGVNVRGLVDAGSVLVGMTSSYLIAFDKAAGRTAWEIQGQYGSSNASTAVAGTVLYFQGPFGFVTSVDGGLWVDSYQALVKVESQE